MKRESISIQMGERCSEAMIATNAGGSTSIDQMWAGTSSPVKLLSVALEQLQVLLARLRIVSVGMLEIQREVAPGADGVPGLQKEFA
jgi:hypothetical protein